MFSGKSKPSPLEDDLKDFLTEYKHLKDNGIVYKGQTYTVNIDALICGVPTRAYLKCIKGHTLYESCGRCIVRATRVTGRMVFTEQECTSRTDDCFSRVEYRNHQTDVSPFIAAGIPCISSFVLDYKHMVCLGVARRLLIYLALGPKICCLSMKAKGCDFLKTNCNERENATSLTLAKASFGEAKGSRCNNCSLLGQELMYRNKTCHVCSKFANCLLLQNGASDTPPEQSLACYVARDAVSAGVS